MSHTAVAEGSGRDTGRSCDSHQGTVYTGAVRAVYTVSAIRGAVKHRAQASTKQSLCIACFSDFGQRCSAQLKFPIPAVLRLHRHAASASVVGCRRSGSCCSWPVPADSSGKDRAGVHRVFAYGRLVYPGSGRIAMYVLSSRCLAVSVGSVYSHAASPPAYACMC